MGVLRLAHLLSKVLRPTMEIDIQWHIAKSKKIIIEVPSFQEKVRESEQREQDFHSNLIGRGMIQDGK